MAEGDAIRNIHGDFSMYFLTGDYGEAENNDTSPVYTLRATARAAITPDSAGGFHHKARFNAARQVPTADENRPLSTVELGVVKF
ncbi:MAG: hypothetical protein LBR05_01115 [Azoarcus sp.]|nr:hypothetical protein [Azoarcus sp.]